MSYPRHVAQVLATAVLLSAPLSAESGGKPEPSTHAISKMDESAGPSIESLKEELLNQPVSAFLSRLLWFPKYTIERPGAERLETKPGLKALVKLTVFSSHTNPDNSEGLDSLKHNWPVSAAEPVRLFWVWVAEGKIVQVGELQPAPRAIQSVLAYSAEVELREEPAGGVPCVLLRQGNQFVETNEDVRNSPAENAGRACILNDSAGLSALLDSGLSPNAELQPGDSLARCAALSGSLDCLSLLKERGAALYSDSPRFAPPLEMAVRNGRVDTVRFLLSCGVLGQGAANMRASTSSYAAKYGHTDVLKLLIDADSRYDRRGGTLSTPLVEAVKANHPEAVGILLNKWKEQTKTEYPAHAPTILELCRLGRTEILKLLVAQGMPVDYQDAKQSTLSCAALSGSAELASLLIKGGASVKWEDEFGVDPLFIACSRGNTAFARVLLENGADINHRTKAGLSALHAALYRGNSGTVELLLKAGANPNSPDAKGETPFQFCLRTGDKLGALSLLKAGAKLAPEDPHLGDYLETVLLLDLAPVLSELLKSGLPPATKINGGWSLCEAAEYSGAKDCRALLRKPGEVELSIPKVQLDNVASLQKEFEQLEAVEPSDPRPLSLDFPATEARAAFLVDETGATRFIRVEDCPDPLLRASIITAIANWRYTPPLYKGAPAQVCVSQTFRFPSAQEFRPPKSNIDVPPMPLSYPPQTISRKAVDQARYALAFTINTAGKPENIRIVKSSHPEFEAEAIQQIKEMLFSPAMSGGEPVSFDIQYTLSIPLFKKAGSSGKADTLTSEAPDSTANEPIRNFPRDSNRVLFEQIFRPLGNSR